MQTRIIPSKIRYDGSFVYFYKKNPEAFQLGGIAVSQGDALLRLGVMPHNNILTNKLINRFGGRALEILKKKQDPDAVRYDDSLICQTIPDEAELIANWDMADILAAMRPLEKLTGQISQEEAEALIKGVIDKLQENIKVDPYSNLPKSQEFNQLIATVKDRREKLLNNCISHLETYQEDLNKKKNDWDHQVTQRDLYRATIADFESLQAVISVKQRFLYNIFFHCQWHKHEYYPKCLL